MFSIIRKILRRVASKTIVQTTAHEVRVLHMFVALQYPIDHQNQTLHSVYSCERNFLRNLSKKSGENSIFITCKILSCISTLFFHVGKKCEFFPLEKIAEIKKKQLVVFPAFSSPAKNIYRRYQHYLSTNFFETSVFLHQHRLLPLNINLYLPEMDKSIRLHNKNGLVALSRM